MYKRVMDLATWNYILESQTRGSDDHEGPLVDLGDEILASYIGIMS